MPEPSSAADLSGAPTDLDRGNSRTASQLRSRARVSSVLCCVAGGLLGLAIFHGPHLASGLQLIPGDELDARFVAYVAEHVYQAALGNTSLPSPAFYFPRTGVLGYSDVHLLIAIPYSILRTIGLDILSAAGGAIIVLTIATWLATFLLLQVGLGFTPIAALVGGFMFAFSSPKLNQMSHPLHQALVLIPAMAWCLVRFLEAAGEGRDRSAWRALGLFSLLFQLQLWTSFQIAWIWAFELAIVTAIAALRRAPRLACRRWVESHGRGVCFLLLANVVALAPFLALHAPVALEYGFREWSTVDASLPRPSSYLLMGNSFLWRAASNRLAYRVQLPLSWEQHLGLGIIGNVALVTSFAWSVLQLAIGEPTSLVQPRTPDGRRQIVMLACLGSLSLFVLTLRIGDASPWRWVWEFLPGAAAIRTVSRYVLVSSLGVSLFLAYAIDVAIARLAAARSLTRRLGAIALAVMAFGLVAEQVGGPSSFDRSSSESRVAGLVEALKAHPECSVFAIPPADRGVWGGPLQVDAMLASIETGRPTVNGYTSWAPRGWRLWDLTNPEYAKLVAEWSTSNGLGEVCMLRGPAP